MLHAVPLLAATRATWPDILVFAAAAAVILVGAVGVVTSRNPVHAALSLVMTLFGVAVLFIEQEADFLAAVQIIVYAGAIVVLFLFVIMFLGVDRAEDINVEPLAGQRPLAVVVSLITLAGVLAMAATAHWVTGAKQVVGPIQGHVAGPNSPAGEPAQLGKQLFTTYLFAFEATAALLVIAVVGAVVLARRPPHRPRRANERQHDRERAAGMSLSGAWYLGLAAIVFTIGAIGLLVRRNVLIMFMCIELMLNAANLTFVTFARMLNDIGGQAIVFFVLVVAAAEVVVGLGIVVTNFRRRDDHGGGRPGLAEGLTPWSISRTSCCCCPSRASCSCWPSAAASATRWPAWIGTVAVGGAFVVACIVLAGLLGLPDDGRVVVDNYFTWFQVGRPAGPRRHAGRPAVDDDVHVHHRRQRASSTCTPSGT